MLRRVARPRVLVYSAVLGAIVAGLLTAITLRVPLKVDIIRDRAAIAERSAIVESVIRATGPRVVARIRVGQRKVIKFLNEQFARQNENILNREES